MDCYTRLLLVQLLGIIIAVCLVHGEEKTYNPLASQLQQHFTTTGFSFHFTDSHLSVMTADYKETNPRFTTFSTRCIRAVVFMAHGAVLHYLQTDCDTPESADGLVTHDSTLTYYNIVAFRQEAPGRFVRFTRTQKKDTCTRKVFVLEEKSGPKPFPSPDVKATEIPEEESCDLAFPPMLLLSSSDSKEKGTFEPVSEEWMSYYAGAPLGLLSQEYRTKDKCYRLVVITSGQRVVRSVKLTCGPIHDVTSTDGSLRLGNTLYATVDSDTVTVLLNTGNNYCIKKMETTEGEDSDNVLTKKDKDCHQLIKGEVEGSTVDMEILGKLKASPVEIEVKKESETKIISYTPSGELFYYYTMKDMGIMVQTYTNGVDQKKSKIVTLVVRGVLVRSVIVEAGPPRQIVIQEKKIYYDKDVVFTKLHAEDGYEVLQRLDEENCLRKLFTVKEKNGSLTNIDANGPATKQKGTAKETTTTKPRGNINNDDDCKNLIGGLHLKDMEALLSKVRND